MNFSLPFSLTMRPVDAVCVECTKCLKQRREDEELAESNGRRPILRQVRIATNDLLQGAYRWPLCNNHSAAAAHLYGIFHPTFNPAPAAKPKE